MNNFFFYGTLRSIPILETVIGHQSNYLQFTPAFAPKSELRLVLNETFPVIVFHDSYAGVHGTLVKGLNGEDINRILFFEDVEFTPQQLNLEVKGEIEQASYFSQQMSDLPRSFGRLMNGNPKMNVSPLSPPSFGWSYMENTQPKKRTDIGMTLNKPH